MGDLEGFKIFHGEKVMHYIEEYMLSLNLEEKIEGDIEDNMEETELERVIDIGTKCIARCNNKNSSRRCIQDKKDEYFCKKHRKEYEDDILNFGLMNEKRPEIWRGVGTKTLISKKGKQIPWKNEEDDNDLIYCPNVSGNDHSKDKQIKNKSENVKSEVKVEVKKKVIKKGRKCGLCGEVGHNKTTCTKNKKITKKEIPKTPDIPEISKLPDTEVTSKDMDIVPAVCDKCNEYPCDCETIPLDITEIKEQEELLSDNENEFIPYQGVNYYYDREMNILSNIIDYGEVGKWNSKNECIDWFDEEYEQNHIEHPDYSP